MPAHEDRKQILCRMWQDEQIRLDALCIALGNGEPLGRSDLVNRLVAEAYERLPEQRRLTATDTARLSIVLRRVEPPEEPVPAPPPVVEERPRRRKTARAVPNLSAAHRARATARAKAAFKDKKKRALSARS